MNWFVLVQVPAAAAAAYVRFMLTTWFAIMVAVVVCLLVVRGLPKGEPRERTYSREDNIAVSLTLAHQAEAELKSCTKDSIEAADLCIEIANRYGEGDDFPKACDYAARAVAVFQKQSFRIGQSNPEIATKLKHAQEWLRAWEDLRINGRPPLKRRTWSQWYSQLSEWYWHQEVSTDM